MAEKISRRRLADYVADQLVAGGEREKILAELGAYLIETRRTKEADLIALDVETALARRGQVVADVASARELSASVRQQIQAFIDREHPNSTISLRETVDPSLIGGVKVAFAGRELDETVRYKLQTLKASKI